MGNEQLNVLLSFNFVFAGFKIQISMFFKEIGYNNQHRNAVCQQLNMQSDDPMQVNVASIILIAITMVLNNHVIDVDTLRGLNLLVDIPQMVKLQEQQEKQAQMQEMNHRFGGIENQLKEMNHRFGGLEVRLGGIENQLNQIIQLLNH